MKTKVKVCPRCQHSQIRKEGQSRDTWTIIGMVSFLIGLFIVIAGFLVGAVIFLPLILLSFLIGGLIAGCGGIALIVALFLPKSFNKCMGCGYEWF